MSHIFCLRMAPPDPATIFNQDRYSLSQDLEPKRGDCSTRRPRTSHGKYHVRPLPKSTSAPPTGIENSSKGQCRHLTMDIETITVSSSDEALSQKSEIDFCALKSGVSFHAQGLLKIRYFYFVLPMFLLVLEYEDHPLNILRVSPTQVCKSL
jgi:hypothetical protein